MKLYERQSTRGWAVTAHDSADMRAEVTVNAQDYNDGRSVWLQAGARLTPDELDDFASSLVACAEMIRRQRDYALPMDAA